MPEQNQIIEPFGKIYYFSNDIEFAKAIHRGQLYEQELIVQCILPFLQTLDLL